MARAAVGRVHTWLWAPIGSSKARPKRRHGEDGEHCRGQGDPPDAPALQHDGLSLRGELAELGEQVPGSRFMKARSCVGLATPRVAAKASASSASVK